MGEQLQRAGGPERPVGSAARGPLLRANFAGADGGKVQAHCPVVGDGPCGNAEVGALWSRLIDAHLHGLRSAEVTGRITDPRVVYAPLSDIAERLEDALPEAARDPQAEIVVFCHLGERSAQVSAWLQTQAYAHVFNLAGGIDAYAYQVDPSIRRY